MRQIRGSAAVALEVFTREKIGVETASWPMPSCSGVLNGRLRDNVVHFKTVGEATQAARRRQDRGRDGPRAELEAALKGRRARHRQPSASPSSRWQLASAWR